MRLLLTHSQLLIVKFFFMSASFRIFYLWSNCSLFCSVIIRLSYIFFIAKLWVWSQSPPVCLHWGRLAPAHWAVNMADIQLGTVPLQLLNGPSTATGQSPNIYWTVPLQLLDGSSTATGRSLYIYWTVPLKLLDGPSIATGRSHYSFI